MDKTDVQILHDLQQNARVSYRELERALHWRCSQATHFGRHLSVTRG
jgi:DNA-binding Lrp family transcriptional regulator